jgi:hypothetical protein
VNWRHPEAFLVRTTGLGTRRRLECTPNPLSTRLAGQIVACLTARADSLADGKA